MAKEDYDKDKDKTVFLAGEVRLGDDRLRVHVKMNSNSSKPDLVPKIAFERVLKGKKEGYFLKRLTAEQVLATVEMQVSAAEWIQAQAAAAETAAAPAAKPAKSKKAA